METPQKSVKPDATQTQANESTSLEQSIEKDGIRNEDQKDMKGGDALDISVTQPVNNEKDEGG